MRTERKKSKFTPFFLQTHHGCKIMVCVLERNHLEHLYDAKFDIYISPVIADFVHTKCRVLSLDTQAAETP